MLSRWYSIFLGIMLLVLGIAGYLAPQFLGAVNLGMLTPTIWVITALVAFWFGFGSRSVGAIRGFAGIVGTLYILWGVISLFTAPVAEALNLMQLLSTMMVLLGSLGLAAALAPAYWLREHETYAPGTA